MTAPSKAPSIPRAAISAARAHKQRRFPVSDGAPVEVVEDGPSLAGRLVGLAAMLTIKPTLAIGSYAPKMPWPWEMVDFACRILRPPPGTVRATIGLANCDAQLVRAPGVLPADGERSVILYLHGGAFLTCGVNTHHRVVNALSGYADSPVLVVNYRMIPKHSVGQAVDDCYDAYQWLRRRGYEPDQIVLAGDSAGGYLSLALAQRLLHEGEEPAAMVAMSPLFEIDNQGRADHPNIRSDAMFPAHAFTALVQLIEEANRRNPVDAGDLRAARPHRARPAPHADPRLRIGGADQRRQKGRATARPVRGTRRDPYLACSDACFPACVPHGEGGDAVAAPDRRVHP